MTENNPELAYFGSNSAGVGREPKKRKEKKGKCQTEETGIFETKEVMKIDELMEGACKKCKTCIGATG